jgi:hypothetical protein
MWLSLSLKAGNEISALKIRNVPIYVLRSALYLFHC